MYWMKHIKKALLTKFDMTRLKVDSQYIFLNFIINKIPSWGIRQYFYKRCGMKLGYGCRIGIGTIVVSPEKIIIGNRSIICEFCHLDGRGGLYISSDVGISNYVRIFSATHDINSDSFKYKENKVFIENHAWVASGATILDNTNIGPYAVVGAGTVFKGKLNPYEVVTQLNKSKRRKVDNYKNDYRPFFR